MHKHHVNLKDLKQTLSKCLISAQSDGNHNDEHIWLILLALAPGSLR